MSKDTEETANITSPAVKPGSCCIESTKFMSALCGISTPLGLPVEPEV